MRFRFGPLILCVLAGCAASLPRAARNPSAEDRTAIEAAVYAWRIAGLPWSKTCDDESTRMRVVVTDPTEFTELCGRRPVHAGGSLYACNTQQNEQMFPYSLIDSDHVPLLVISQLQPEEHRRLLVVHETMHWLERCSGKGIDFDHADQRVWRGARLLAQRDVERLFATSGR
ncbi:MAG: hypothetical protein ABW321_01340 [Polyangiales bacterium]